MQVSFNSYLPSRKTSHPRRLDMPFFKSWTKGQPFTVLFKNTWILKFESQLTFAFCATINLLSGPLRKQNFTVTGSKSHSLWFVIGGFHPFFAFLCFKVRCLWSLYDWPQQKVHVWRQLLNFRVCMFLKNTVNQYPLCRCISLKQILICWKNLIKDQSHSLWWSS